MDSILIVLFKLIQAKFDIQKWRSQALPEMKVGDLGPCAHPVPPHMLCLRAHCVKSEISLDTGQCAQSGHLPARSNQWHIM